MNVYKYGWLMAAILIVGMFGVTTVKAITSSECDDLISRFKDNYNNYDPEFDFNNDGVVDLIDVGELGVMCNNPEPEHHNKKVFTKRSSTTRVYPQSDGSITYGVYGRAFQLEKGVVLRWTPGFLGQITYNNKFVTIEDGVGVNIRVVYDD